MSELSLIKCDGCGTVFGEGGYNESGWGEVHAPYKIMPPFSSSIRARNLATLNYCPNCWKQIEPSLPKLRNRPLHPGEEEVNKKSGHQI